ncbi:MAG: hypothetical protein L3J91_02150 [Thermoplasmata archaeon]|nr:hypothetical protein [Thermoplasmata archaeon]
MVTIEPAAQFSNGAAIELPPSEVERAGGLLADGLAAGRFTVTHRDLPGTPARRGLLQRPATTRVVIADRDVATVARFDGSTKGFVAALFLLYASAVLAILAVEQGCRIHVIILGAFAFLVPPYARSSYRGRGYVGMTAVAVVSSRIPIDGATPGSSTVLPLRIRIGAGRATARQSVGRDLAHWWIRTVQPPPESAAATQAL